MLKSLSIRNIALVDQCEIEFSSGLNVLSGETGSGKSVILDSINFVLGQKADKTMIMHGKAECSAACEFDISNCEAAKLALEEIGLDIEDSIIIKRTFSTEKGGAIRLNGESVTASMLRKVTSHLVDVHGQSDHFALLNTDAQLKLIDEISQNEASIKAEISDAVFEIKEILKKLSSVGGSAEEREKRLDYLDFAINEIQNSAYFEGEEEQLAIKRKMLQNLEKITLAIATAQELLDGEGGASDKIVEADRQLSSIAQYGDDYSKIYDDLSLISDNLSDVCRRLTDSLDTEYDVNEADLTEKRLEFISALRAKYGKNYSEVMLTLEKMIEEADTIRHGEEIYKKLSVELVDKRSRLKSLYDKLTAERKTVSIDLSTKLKDKLCELGMKNADFSVEFTSSYTEEKLDCNGADEICFLFSANKGEPLKALSKVISGGELSRLMLAVKSVTADSHSAETFIFDEIDTGISGTAAFIVSQNFAQISKKRQIIAISHLPQIVAMSDVSLLIEKSETETSTRTQVKLLSEEQKVGELVRLVGGDLTSASAVSHAREMLLKADGYKKAL